MHHWRRAAFTPKVRKNVAAKCSPNLFLSKILFASSVLKFLGAVRSRGTATGSRIQTSEQPLSRPPCARLEPRQRARFPCYGPIFFL